MFATFEICEFRDAVEALLDRDLEKTGETGEAGTEWCSSRANSNSWGDGKDKTRGELVEATVTRPVSECEWSSPAVVAVNWCGQGDTFRIER